MSTSKLGIMQNDHIDLSRMVHLALNSSPNVGIVNFNILKTFLLELLNALNLQHFEPHFTDNNDIKSVLVDAIKNEGNNSGEEQLSEHDNKVSISLNNSKALFPDRIQLLENKINRLEQQIASLNSIPSSQDIIKKSKENARTGMNSGPILEIWQYTQLSKRQESNEEGITKLTSILQDLISELNDFKDSQNQLGNDIKTVMTKSDRLADILAELERLKGVLPTVNEMKSSIEYLTKQLNGFMKLNDSIEDILKQLKEQSEKTNLAATYDELNKYIKWDDLEGKIKLNGETRIYTSGQNASNNPEFKKCLGELGTLNERHENLKDLVDNLRLEMGKKPNEARLPDDFTQKMEDLKNLKMAFEELLNNFNSENKSRATMENLLNKLNQDIESFRKSIKELLENTQLNTKEINELKEALKNLDEAKANKNWAMNEIKNKADLRDINNKLNKSIFDDFLKDVNNSLHDLSNKDNELDSEMKTNNQNVFKELENKLDRLEVESLKDYIEKQLKKLKKLQKDHDFQPQNFIQGEDDAAGVTKPFLRFHCISCARPITLNQHQAIPSLPMERGIRPIQTPRPYTTYELDQIRQYQKQQFTQGNESAYDLFSTERQCGGPHTMTLPHKKLVKINQADASETSVHDAHQVPVSRKSEVQIQGQDGQIYKGRLDAKLNIEMKKNLVKSYNTRSLKSAPADKSPPHDRINILSEKSMYNL